jgi:hypothetical protein
MLDLTQGNKAEQFARKVAKTLGIEYQPQGGLYDDLRQMEEQLAPDKVADLATQSKIRAVVDKMTKGYDAIKAPWAGTFDTDNFYEVVLKNREVPIIGRAK